MRRGILFAVTDNADHRRCDGYHFVDRAADRGNEKIVDQNQRGGQKNAPSQILRVEVAHGKRIEHQAYHKERGMRAFPGEDAEHAHDQSEHDGNGFA